MREQTSGSINALAETPEPRLDARPDLRNSQLHALKSEIHSTVKKILLQVFTVVLALAGVLALSLATHSGTKDYIAYWTSAKLLLRHSDPYSPAQVFALEQAHGHLAPTPLIMRNPPWAMFLVAPLAFADPRTGFFLWTLAAIGCILLSIHLLNIPSRTGPYAFVFAPAVACIFSGQSSPFLLLGFALFLRFHRSRPLLAGAALLLLAIKPHLFLVFWAVLLIDCICRRSFRILAGFVSSVALASAFATIFDPRIWAHYAAMLRASALSNEFFPTASMELRLLIAPHATWLLFVPSVLALVWGIWYYLRHLTIWNWRTHGMLLILVTVAASPYGWFTDEIVLLPAVWFALDLPSSRKYSAWILLGINIAALLVVFTSASLTSRAYLWTPLAWLIWFLYATQKFAQHNLNDSMRTEAKITQAAT